MAWQNYSTCTGKWKCINVFFHHRIFHHYLTPFKKPSKSFINMVESYLEYLQIHISIKSDLTLLCDGVRVVRLLMRQCLWRKPAKENKNIVDATTTETQRELSD